MTAKEYLNRVRRQAYILQQTERELAELRSDLVSIGAASLSDRVSGSKTSDLSDKYVRLERYIAKVAAERDTLIALRTAAKEQIKMLPNEEHQAILYARYINGEAWEDIAHDMHCSWRKAFYLHGRALQSFERLHRFAVANGV
ncbi:DUF1492 domain-containing protein [uncultured Megasphaera sp.]|jgi:hypothetical protein|uniref:DUF1492 domain-containing protein n=1 Tax=uncultured Megasphaera sp. TaxID=165188 RepID=UPI00206CCA3B|nr:DUF1492 domain-containing protein [uncultured Megasphaera sp.]DAQ03872.1 MAG TPA: Protein of unknown function (DUF1492) [Caudoviricetes sp.]